MAQIGSGGAVALDIVGNGVPVGHYLTIQGGQQPGQQAQQAGFSTAIRTGQQQGVARVQRKTQAFEH